MRDEILAAIETRLHMASMPDRAHAQHIIASAAQLYIGNRYGRYVPRGAILNAMADIVIEERAKRERRQ